MENEFEKIPEKKVCTACMIEKSLENFPVDKTRRDGHREQCKPCRQKRKRWWRYINPEKVAAGAVRWRERHPDHMRVYRNNNREKIAAITHRHYLKIKDNPKEVLNRKIFRGIHRALKDNRDGVLWVSLVGYNREKLRDHLEWLFKQGMTWDNYGKWEIDHKIPLSAFEFTTIDDPDFKKCWALENIQPLWAIENSKKGRKIP